MRMIKWIGINSRIGLGGLIAWLITILPGCVALKNSDLDKYLVSSRNLNKQKEVVWEKAAVIDSFNAGDINKYKVVEGKFEILKGKLWATEGDKNRAILLMPCQYDPIRVEFNATLFALDGKIGDITILLNASPDKNFFDNGYALTTGSYWNNCTTFYKKGRALARTEYSPLKSGKKNHVVLEFDHGHIRYWLNDVILLEAWDDTPLPLDPALWVGIRTWATRMCIDNIAVYHSREGTP